MCLFLAAANCVSLLMVFRMSIVPYVEIHSVVAHLLDVFNFPLTPNFVCFFGTALDIADVVLRVLFLNFR